MIKSTVAHAFRFLVESQVWIALCALATTNTTNIILNGKNLTWPIALFVFSIVLSVYSWYYFNNRNYPFARKFAIFFSIISMAMYSYSQFPKPLLIAFISILSGLYMIPIAHKKPLKLIIRWFILCVVWTLFTFFLPYKNTASTFYSTPIFFAYRMLFIGNLGFIFLLKDERSNLSNSIVVFMRNLLLFAQGLSIFCLFLIGNTYLGIAFGLITLLLWLFFKLQTPRSSIYFYSLGIDGLLILESIFVQSLFIYGLGRFPAF